MGANLLPGKAAHMDLIMKNGQLLTGCGSKLNRRGYAGFGPCFHLPGFHFGTGLLSHSQKSHWVCVCVCLSWFEARTLSGLFRRETKRKPLPFCGSDS